MAHLLDARRDGGDDQHQGQAHHGPVLPHHRSQVPQILLVSTYREVCDFKEEGEEANEEKNELLEKNPIDMVLNVPEKILILNWTLFLRYVI